MRISASKSDVSRWINETLYTTDSQEAHELMQDDPSIFNEVRIASPTTKKLTAVQTVPRGIRRADKVLASKPC